MPSLVVVTSALRGGCRAAPVLPLAVIAFRFAVLRDRRKDEERKDTIVDNVAGALKSHAGVVHLFAALVLATEGFVLKANVVRLRRAGERASERRGEGCDNGVDGDGAHGLDFLCTHCASRMTFGNEPPTCLRVAFVKTTSVVVPSMRT